MAWKTKEKDPNGDPHHFYAVSFACWKVNTNLESLIRSMKREGDPFTIYRLRLPITASYKIKDYVPVVAPESISFIGTWVQEK